MIFVNQIKEVIRLEEKKEEEKKVSMSELKEELKRREIKMREAPEMKKNPELEPLRKLLEEYVEEVTKEDYCDDNDYAHYIYEAVIGAFFGEVFWKWYNANT